MIQKEGHNEEDVADLADGEVQQLSASILSHLLQRELFPRARPLSSY